MQARQKLWLVTNSASGSNSEQAVSSLADHIADCGFELDRMLGFPDDDLPDRAMLEAAQVDILAVFTGDGTVNACVTRLYGWAGAVLVLPGGTMNILSGKLHGEADEREILARVASGACSRRRLPVVRSGHGDALVGFMGGPATAWYDVREAMRDVDVVKIVGEAGHAMHESTQASPVRICDPAIGTSEGYPLIEVVPVEQGLQVVVYNPQSVSDYVRQGWATLIRHFREGPHQVLGTFEQLVLEDVEHGPLALSIDGEPQAGNPREELRVAHTDVDLLATA